MKLLNKNDYSTMEIFHKHSAVFDHNFFNKFSGVFK